VMIYFIAGLSLFRVREQDISAV